MPSLHQQASLLPLCRQAMQGAVLAVDQWVGCTLTLEDPIPVTLADFQGYVNRSKQGHSLILQLKGDAAGALAVHLSPGMIQTLLKSLVKEEIDLTRPLSRSALLELVNLIGSSLANTLAEAAELSLLPSVPELMESESGGLPDYFSASALGVRIDLGCSGGGGSEGAVFIFLHPEGLTQLLGDGTK